MKESDVRWKWDRPWMYFVPTLPIVGLFLWNWKVGLGWLLATCAAARRND